MVNWDGEAIGPTHVGIPDEGDDCSMISQVTLEMEHEFFCLDCVKKAEPCKECKWRMRN